MAAVPGAGGGTAAAGAASAASRSAMTRAVRRTDPSGAVGRSVTVSRVARGAPAATARSYGPHPRAGLVPAVAHTAHPRPGPAAGRAIY